MGKNKNIIYKVFRKEEDFTNETLGENIFTDKDYRKCMNFVLENKQKDQEIIYNEYKNNHNSIQFRYFIYKYQEDDLVNGQEVFDSFDNNEYDYA